nr:hypothetical protein SHINE37_100021 [Rhizobiaceae bacterium]
MDEAGLPARLRTMVRRRESWLVLLAILIGIAVAACQHKRLCSQTSAFSARII